MEMTFLLNNYLIRMEHTFLLISTVHHTTNHWSNEETVIYFVRNIIIPYVKDKRQNMGTPDQTALVFFMRFLGRQPQLYTYSVHVPEGSGIGYMYGHIPAGYSNKLQLVDLTLCQKLT